MHSFRIISPEFGKPFTIGRKSDNCLVLDNPMVSRYHAVLELDSNQWILKNLTRNSVTQLNGVDVEVYSEELPKCVTVEDGDIILIGPHQLRATLKGMSLSLLLMDSAASNEADLPEGVSTQISKGAAILTFKGKVISPLGKSVGQLKLTEGESIRLPGYEMSYTAGNISCRNIPQGFDVDIRNLDVYAGKKQLLRDINLHLPAGEILAIIGRSGQGKSTFLKLLQGINRAGEQSEVRIGGLDYRNQEVRKHIAFLEQDPELRKDLTVKETLLDGGRISMSKSDFRQNVQGRQEKFCELFGLSERINNAVKTLSGGEMRRTALARELMGSPGLIILDEPLSGLDPYNSKILCTHLKQLAFLGHTIILTTHSYEALEIANKVLVLHRGEQGFYGSPAEAYHYFKTQDPEQILSGLNDETSILWKNTVKSTRNLSLSNSKENNLYFPRTKLSSVFFYKVGLAAKQWVRDKGKLLTLIFQPLIIGFLFSQIFSSLSSLWIVAFATILSANWLALSLSIREIVQEKSILTNEFRKGVPVLSTLTAKVLLPTLVAWVQTLVVYLFINFRMTLHVSPLPLALTLLAMILPAVTMGLMVSNFSKNAGQANAMLPLLIIPQVALAGALVPLDQMLPIGRALSTIIWSRFNQNSLLNLFLEREDPIVNSLAAIGLALDFYIVMVISTYCTKKAK